MAIAKDIIDDNRRPAFGNAVSRRPAVIGGALFAGLIALTLVLTNDSNARTPEAQQESALIVPDRASAERLRARAKLPAQGEPSVEQLGVLNDVPSLQEPGLEGSVETLLQKQQQQFEQFELASQKQFLDSRLQGRGASLRVPEFEAMKAEREAQTVNFLNGLGGGEATGSDGSAGLGALGGLGSLGAGPALAALSGASGSGMPSGVGGGGELGGDPNQSAAKLDFFRNGGQQLEPGRLEAQVQRPGSPYELQMGSIIPGVMISGINSEAPGQIIGQVSENVYDSATGSHLLIPQGSRLVGTYSALISKGQARVQVAWVRLNFPNGNKLDLGGMSGTDQAGMSGFRDRVNRHIGARLAAALMTSAFTVGYELTAPRNGNFVEGAVHRGVGESVVQLGTDIAKQEGQRPPTLEIRPGYRFSVAVSKDIVFAGPYEDGIQRRRRP